MFLAISALSSVVEVISLHMHWHASTVFRVCVVLIFGDCLLIGCIVGLPLNFVFIAVVIKFCFNVKAVVEILKSSATKRKYL